MNLWYEASNKLISFSDNCLPSRLSSISLIERGKYELSISIYLLLNCPNYCQFYLKVYLKQLTFLSSALKYLNNSFDIHIILHTYFQNLDTLCLIQHYIAYFAISRHILHL